jgi:hypothetical protein
MPLPFAIKTRRVIKALALTFMILGVSGVTMFISSKHRSRLALESYTLVQASSLYSPISSVDEATASSIGEIKAILQPFNEIPRRYDLPIVQSDSPGECVNAFANGRVMDCHGMALSAIEKLRQYDVRSRMWDLTGTDGFGGNGHNVIEYYNTSSQRWEMIDPNYSSYVVRTADETVLSVAELREALLTNAGELEVRYYGSSVELRKPESLLQEYRSLMPSSSLLSATDYRERYQNRYAFLMPLASVLDKLPLSAQRGLRSFVMGKNDAKLLIADRYTPEYRLALLKTLWYLSLSMLALGFCFTIAWFFTTPRIVLAGMHLFSKNTRKSAVRNGLI